MMNRIALFLSLFILSFGFLQAQNKGDDIIGYYYLEDPFSKEKSQIYIYRTQTGLYEGKITWVDNEEKKNFIGLVFLKDLPFDEENNEWGKGSIKYPGKKGTFSINARFDNPKTLRVRGFWGIAMMGKTVYWTKEDTLRE